MFERLKAILNRGKTERQNPESSRVIVNPRTLAGAYVTADTALQEATVWACVQYLTRTVAQLPWNVMQETADGSVKRATTRDGQDVAYLLHERPCPEMSSFSFRQALLGSALLNGDGYAEIEWNNRGTAYALWPLHYDRVKPRRRDDGRLYYQVWNNAGGSVEVEAESMFHIRGFGDGPVGYNVIAYAAQSIGWAKATELFGSSSFGSGMNPSLIIEAPTALSPAGLTELKASFKKLYAGPKGEKTMFLDAGMKAHEIGQKLVDAQFIETRQHQVEEICRWFGVPPHKVQHLLRATFSNIEHQSIEVVVDSITPWVLAFEQEANYKLFGANRSGLFTKMNLRGLLRGDAASRIAYYKGLFELGLPLNQILALDDLNGIGPDGDVSFVSNNVQTLKNAIEGKPLGATPPKTGKKPAAPPPPKSKRKNGASHVNGSIM